MTKLKGEKQSEIAFCKIKENYPQFWKTVLTSPQKRSISKPSSFARRNLTVSLVTLINGPAKQEWFE